MNSRRVDFHKTDQAIWFHAVTEKQVLVYTE